MKILLIGCPAIGLENIRLIMLNDMPLQNIVMESIDEVPLIANSYELPILPVDLLTVKPLNVKRPANEFFVPKHILNKRKKKK